MDKKYGRKFALLLCVIFVSTSLTGCETLRKKFVRKKNAEKAEEGVPVYEPIEYASAAKNPADKYSYHYSLWQGWYKELLTQLNRKDNVKRMRYLAAQLKVQIERMQEYISEESRDQFSDIQTDIDKIVEQMDRPLHMLDTRSLYSQVLKLESKMRNNFNPEKMQDSLL